MKVNEHIKGFTLLELLIAIAIFALLATACYRLLYTAISTQKTTSFVWDQLRIIQKARVIVQKDINQIIARPIRNSMGQQEFAFSGEIPTKGEGVFMTFSRSGWHNFTDSPRSNIQRIAYAFEDGLFIRYYWPILDLATDTQPFRQVVLDEINKISLQFLDQKKRWLTQWPPVSEQQKQRITLQPAAVRIVIDHAKYGELDWWFQGVGMPPKSKKINTENKDTKNSSSNSVPSFSEDEEDEDE